MSRRIILGIDSATTRIAVATGVLDAADPSAVVGVRSTEWAAGYRHGETLLATIDGFLVETGIDRAEIAAIAVGTGPGAFTGLRVGIATAKGLAHGLGRPIVGVPTGDAILAAAPAGAVLLLPAGPADRLLIRAGQPAELVPAGEMADIAPDETVVAIDLPGRAPDDALERGEAARASLGTWLIRLAAVRLADGLADDLAGLVPEYVTLPRGVREEAGEVAWSRDRR